MEPLSITASIVSVIQLTGVVIGYIGEISNASPDRKLILNDIQHCHYLLYCLKDQVEQTQNPPIKDLRWLVAPNGPLVTYKEALEAIAEKMKPSTRIQKLKKLASWPFDKSEIKDVLSTIERHKSLFLLALEGYNIELSRAIHTILEDVRQQVSDIRVSQEAHVLHDEQSQTILAWLSPLNFEAKQIDYIRRREEGTCNWIFDQPVFVRWLEGSIPGAGKTILASAIIDYLQRNMIETKDIAVTFIYCSSTESNVHIEDFLGSLLRQFLRQQSSLPVEIKSVYKRHVKDGTRPSVHEYSELLQSQARAFSNIFIILDALDECLEERGLRDHLLSELQKFPSQLLITSRPHISDITRHFGTLNRLEIRASETDIRQYLRMRIDKEQRLQQLIKTNTQLHFESMAKQLNIRDLRSEIVRLPRSLEDTYTQLWKRISSQSEKEVELATRILIWISNAKRPLSATELQHAVALNPESKEIDDEGLTALDVMISLCAGAVTIDQESNIIRFVHYTAKRHFENQFTGNNDLVAKTCITYLTLKPSGEQFIKVVTPGLVYLQEKKYPLENYALMYWGEHAQKCQQTIQKRILEFLECEKITEVINARSALSHWWRQRRPQSIPNVCILAMFGMQELLRTILNADNMAATDSSGWTPLHYAAFENQEDIIHVLLEKGAHVEAEDDEGDTALILAIRKGYMNIVSQFLDTKPVIVSRVTSALHVAAEGGHVEIVCRLLEEGNNIEVRDAHGRTALHVAALNGSEEVLRLLLEQDVDINATCHQAKTALHYAAFSESEGPIKMLIDKIDIEATDRDGRTALHIAAISYNVYKNNWRWLIENGANIGVRDKRNLTPLHLAAGLNNSALVQKLLQSGAERMAKDQDDRTALHYAAYKGCEEVVTLLLEGQTNLEAKDRYGQTVLHCASRSRRVSIVRMLLSKGADIKVKDEFDRTPLHLAAGSSGWEIVELLLKNGAEVETRDTEGWTALHHAADANSPMSAEELITKGASLEVRNNDGNRPLDIALISKSNHLEVIHVLQLYDCSGK